ncbi:hypothetical protein [Enterococcus casseliflavus]|uniref:hypothetical protein n=1 Tax=Enterococcus casseliflavus TaxID=37734 RepID=UPI00232BEF5B|nr:hypothetical protein [Enterococcus casseliflavus]MDB1690050.1 hypothetical protein [Enterococcus casseliflavus]
MKFQKKPVVIEAFQYDGDFIYSNGKSYVPEWAMKANEDGTFVWRGEGDLYVKTLEGEMLVSVGDYVIQGVAGEIYPCKPEIFAQSYQAYGEGKARAVGGRSVKSYEEKLRDLLTNESYEAIEWRQSNEEIDGHTVSEVTFKYKQPTPEKRGK